MKHTSRHQQPDHLPHLVLTGEQLTFLANALELQTRMLAKKPANVPGLQRVQDTRDQAKKKIEHIREQQDPTEPIFFEPNEKMILFTAIQLLLLVIEGMPADAEQRGALLIGRTLYASFAPLQEEPEQRKRTQKGKNRK